MIGGVQDTNLLISVFVVICRVILWISCVESPDMILYELLSSKCTVAPKRPDAGGESCRQDSFFCILAKCVL